MVLLLHCDAYLSDITFCPVVKSAIVKYELHIIHEVLYALIFMLSKLALDCAKVHWILDYIGVVGDLKFHEVHWICKNVSFLVTM